jgi:pimeloyl-ACP methyl ester carboxylesterase
MVRRVPQLTRSRPRLFLTDEGSGEPVLLITGWTISAAIFEPVAPLYVPHVRVVTYDHRGAGRSQPWVTPVSASMLAADAARVLDDRGIEHAHVVGLSLGAAIALELAVRMPARVKSLVLIGGAAGGPTMALPPLRDAARAIGGVWRDTLRHRGLWPAAALFSAGFRAEHPDRVAAYMPYFQRHLAPPWAATWQLIAAASFSRRSSLHRVRAPTLVYHGGEDVMTPPGNAEMLAAGIPGAELQIVPGAGHALPLEQPEAAAEALLAWVARHADAQPRPAPARAVARERVTRPFALHTGTFRNTRDALRRWPGA